MSLPLPLGINHKSIVSFKASLRNRLTFLNRESRFVIICGAAKSERNPNPRRDVLLEYAKKHLKGFHFFRAEDVFDALKPKETSDLLSMEDKIAEYSDCIIIVCESESAFAELGAFCLSDKIVKQVLIINDIRHKNSRSFISLGPIARADKMSVFKPVIFGDFQAILRSVPEIEEKIAIIKHKKRSLVDLSSESKFKSLPPKLRLFLIADLIRIFSPIRREEVAGLLQFVYDGGYFDIDLELALLQSLGFIESTENDFLLFKMIEGGFFYTLLGSKQSTLRAAIVRDYFQQDRKRIHLLRQNLGEYAAN